MNHDDEDDSPEAPADIMGTNPTAEEPTPPDETLPVASDAVSNVGPLPGGSGTRIFDFLSTRNLLGYESSRTLHDFAARSLTDNAKAFGNFEKSVADIAASAAGLASTGDMISSAVAGLILPRPPSNFFDSIANWVLPDISQVIQSSVLGRSWQHSFLAQRGYFESFLADVSRALESQVPPNWHGVDLPDRELLFQMVLDEGLPLAWVPSTPILSRVIAAESPKKRRAILGRAWTSIARDCIDQLNSIKGGSRGHLVDFAISATTALLDGHTAAAQSLAATTFDTAIQVIFGAGQKHVRDQRARPDLDSQPLKSALVVGGIWGSHAEFWVKNGDKIPARYSRHATVHAVSKRQYTRINALYAVMHLVALLRLAEDSPDHAAFIR